MSLTTTGLPDNEDPCPGRGSLARAAETKAELVAERGLGGGIHDETMDFDWRARLTVTGFTSRSARVVVAKDREMGLVRGAT